MQCKRHASDKAKVGAENGAGAENDAKARRTMQASDMQERKRKRVRGENHGKACKARRKTKTG